MDTRPNIKLEKSTVEGVNSPIAEETSQEIAKRIQRERFQSLKLVFGQEFLTKFSQMTLEEKAKYHFRIPFCSGYDESLTAQQLKDLISTLDQLRLTYTIYLVPHSEEAHKEFLKTHAEVIKELKGENSDEDITYVDETKLTKEELEKYKKRKILTEEECDKRKILLISKWRETSRWKKSSAGCKKYLGAKGNKFEEKVDSDTTAYHLKHKNIKEETIKQHYIEEGSDYLSWHRSKNSDDKINILIYRGSFPQSLDYLTSHAHEVPVPISSDGQNNQLEEVYQENFFRKEIFQRVQYKLMTPENLEKSIQNQEKAKTEREKYKKKKSQGRGESKALENQEIEVEEEKQEFDSETPEQFLDAEEEILVEEYDQSFENTEEQEDDQFFVNNNQHNNNNEEGRNMHNRQSHVSSNTDDDEYNEDYRAELVEDQSYINDQTQLSLSKSSKSSSGGSSRSGSDSDEETKAKEKIVRLGLDVLLEKLGTDAYIQKLTSIAPSDKRLQDDAPISAPKKKSTSPVNSAKKETIQDGSKKIATPNKAMSSSSYLSKAMTNGGTVKSTVQVPKKEFVPATNPKRKSPPPSSNSRISPPLITNATSVTQNGIGTLHPQNQSLNGSSPPKTGGYTPKNSMQTSSAQAPSRIGMGRGNGGPGN